MPTSLTLTPKDAVVTGALTITNSGTGVVFNGDSTTTITTGGRVQASATAISTTQGWLAGRLKTGVASGAGTSFVVACYGTATPDLIQISWNDVLGVFRGTNVQAAIATGVNSAVQTFSANTDFTVIFKWTSTMIGVSVNGAAFVTAVATTPTASGSVFDIGARSDTGLFPLMGKMSWLAAGKGTLTDADAAILHGYGNTDPTWSQMSVSSWRATLLWTAVDANLTAPLTLTAAS